VRGQRLPILVTVAAPDPILLAVAHGERVDVSRWCLEGHLDFDFDLDLDSTLDVDGNVSRIPHIFPDHFDRLRGEAKRSSRRRRESRKVADESTTAAHRDLPLDPTRNRSRIDRLQTRDQSRDGNVDV